MRHNDRSYRIHLVENLKEIKATLVGHPWPRCTGFRVGAFLFLNDSETPESLEEYAVVLESEQLQVYNLVVVFFSSRNVQATLSHLEEHRQKLLKKGLPLHLGWPLAEKVTFAPHPEGPCPLCQRS